MVAEREYFLSDVRPYYFSWFEAEEVWLGLSGLLCQDGCEDKAVGVAGESKDFLVAAHGG